MDSSSDKSSDTGSGSGFDFDHWRQLSEDDPAGFFAERTRAIEDFLASVPDEQRDKLRRFQAEIDGLRASAGTPLKAVAGMMGMLADHLDAMQGHARQLLDAARELQGTTR